VVLIDAESIHDVDTTGVQSLEELIEDLERDNITLAIARLHNAVRGVLEAADLIDRVGEQNIYLEIDDGVQAFLRRTPPV